MKNLREMKYLLLDLDGVCYGKHNNYSLEKVFGQVSKRMTQFISNRLKIDLITHIYPDHYIFQTDDFRFEDEYKIIMTEKDFIKASKYSLKNTYYLPTKINVDNDIKIMLNDKIIELLKV